LIYIALLVAVFWYVGRWGWLGIVIRIICAGLLFLRFLDILANLPR
jgi:hypothetical protein